MFPPQFYYPIFIHLILIFSLIEYNQLANKSVYRLLSIKKNDTLIWLFSILFIIVVGLRPISGRYFGDTSNYARMYYNIMFHNSTSSEWLFDKMMALCSPIMDVQGFFLIVEVGYVLLILLSCRRLMPNNITLSMLFCFGAFSFFSYGTNGIRNGLACSFVLLAFSYIQGNKKDKIIASILCICAYNLHHSTALPIACMLFSLVYGNTKVIYTFWIGAIFISAVAGGFVENLFSGLGFDDRLDRYLHDQESDHMFSSLGFRWDFLLYSAMPIWLGWYVVFKKKRVDSEYLLLLHTYMLSNAFWVMMIRAAYSNRFAYLSWFIYPIVLAYPLLVFPIWKNQGKKVGFILIAHVLFTYIMWIKG